MQEADQNAKNAPSYFNYWGKTKKEPSESEPAYHLLAYHCLDVAAVAHVLLQNHTAYVSHFSQLTGLDQEQFKKWFVFLLALHDLGKFGDSFQNLKPSVLQELQGRTSDRGYVLRHDSMGWVFWKHHVRKQFQLAGLIPQAGGSKRRASRALPIDYWVSAMVGHHGQPPNATGVVPVNDCIDLDKDFLAVSAFIDDLIPILLGDNCAFPECETKSIQLASWWLSGLAVLCDWLGSNTNFFRYYCHNPKNPIPLVEYWENAKKYAEIAVKKVGILSSPTSSLLEINDLIGKSHKAVVKPTRLQTAASNYAIVGSAHLFILEDVTGSGKTEAAILLAHRLMSAGQANSLYFALPTMATANTMYLRMRKVYRKLFIKEASPSLVLAHGSSTSSKEFRQSIFPEQIENIESYGDGTTTAGAHCNAWLADNRKKALLADIGVGTIDQALLAILPSRHQSLRMLGLINKILIIDEVHACDAYMHELLCVLLRAHASAGGSAILLSATLSHEQRQSLIKNYALGHSWSTPIFSATDNTDYPLLSSLNSEGLHEQVIATQESMHRRVQIQFLHTEESLYEVLEKAVANEQCVCWIRNTVKDASESYQILSELHREWDIDLFHARYALSDRLIIENRVRESFGSDSSAQKRKGKVLIATQVVEQSLDLDFDVMISDLAPIDLIIQRAGRLRRHARNVHGNRVEGKDQRGMAVLHIHSPPLSDSLKPDWYARFFPHAGKVYEHHGQLWLTAKLLEEHKEFKMPEDARCLIEGVYSETEQEKIPIELLQQSIESEGSDRANASHARMNALKIDLGYTDASSNCWWDEAKTPTRLGEETTLIYLAKWENGKLIPWSNELEHAWQNSAVAMRTYWVAKEATHDGIPLEHIGDCKNQLPAKGKWGFLLPLKRITKDKWQGCALNQKNEICYFQYSQRFGVMVSAGPPQKAVAQHL